MARIVIVSPSEDSRSKLSALLTSSGFQVFRCCSSGSELRRALSESEDCVVVMIGYTPDCKPDELMWDYKDSIQILLIARPLVLDRCEAPEIFSLPLPLSSQALIGAVQMLSQLHQMRLPKRTGTEKETVDQAKQLLMKRHGITEPEAHRALQQYAMNHGIKMADYAAQILRASRETDQ